MDLIKPIQNFLGNYFLQKEAKHLVREKAFLNLTQAKTIGIVFDATLKEDFDLVKKYIVYLKEMKKRVKAIGFFNQKEIPVIAYSKLEYDFFSLKELTWYNAPSNVYVQNFMEEKYDLTQVPVGDGFSEKDEEGEDLGIADDEVATEGSEEEL